MLVTKDILDNLYSQPYFESHQEIRPRSYQRKKRRFESRWNTTGKENGHMVPNREQKSCAGIPHPEVFLSQRQQEVSEKGRTWS